MVSAVKGGVCGERGTEGVERYKEPSKGVWRTEKEEERKNNIRPERIKCLFGHNLQQWTLR